MYFFGGFKTNNYSFYTDLWSFDATPLLTTGIREANMVADELKVYPNPISPDGSLSISSSEEGELSFYNSIGQLLYTTPVHAGISHIDCGLLHTDAGLVFYSAQMHSGMTVNGKVVVVR